MTFSRSTTVHNQTLLSVLFGCDKGEEKKRLESSLPSDCSKLLFIHTVISSFRVAYMTPDEWKENNVSFLPQLIHHCDNVPWDVQLRFLLHSTFNHVSVQSILTGNVLKTSSPYCAHCFYLFSTRSPFGLLFGYVPTIYRHCSNLMAVPVRLGVKHHPPRQRYPVLSELTLTRAAACIRNKHRELLLLLLWRGRSNVAQRILVPAKQQSDARRGSLLPPCSSAAASLRELALSKLFPCPASFWQEW